LLAQRTAAIVGHAIPNAAIPMGVATSVFDAASHATAASGHGDRPTVLFVGKFVPKKGVPVLLAAMAQLRAAGVQARLQLIGGGPLEESLRAEARRLAVDEDVEFLGWVKNHELPGRYARADVVCVPSIEDAHGETEGTPVVLQEALSCGALVVASRSSGIGDVLRDGENGWIVPPGDAVALATALRAALAAPPDTKSAIRAAARATAAESAWPRVAARFFDFFTAASGRQRR
jgi:colanic acid/amylovoran biosynthesis glycosyltransferase